MRRHPVGFLPLCLAVLCERCAAFMLASSLVLMLCERYGYPRDEALRTAGLITAAGYLGSLPGGLVADRLLGPRRALTGSLFLLMVGYALLMLPSVLALWSAVAVLVLGNSLFKPSAQAVLGRLYTPTDPRLDRAQVWLHLLINVGALLGAVVAGLATQRWGWTGCFAVTASVVCIGRVCLSVGRRDTPVSKQSDAPSPSTTPTDSLSTWQRVKTIAVLTLAMLLFNVCFGQVEGALLLWATQHIDRTLLGFTVPRRGSQGFRRCWYSSLRPSSSCCCHAFSVEPKRRTSSPSDCWQRRWPSSSCCPPSSGARHSSSAWAGSPPVTRYWSSAKRSLAHSVWLKCFDSPHLDSLARSWASGSSPVLSAIGSLAKSARCGSGGRPLADWSS